MSSGVEYASFLIRLWRQTGPDAAGNPFDWQSEVEHIQSGRQQIEYPEGFLGKEAHGDGDQEKG
jgi:hypothetical protein